MAAFCRVKIPALFGISAVMAIQVEGKCDLRWDYAPYPSERTYTPLVPLAGSACAPRLRVAIVPYGFIFVFYW
jgi:hypothetical protein